MKPLISYYGGKQRIASQIVAVLNTIRHTVYCEPFFGGGAVFFARERPIATSNAHYREVINDRSELLINMYRVARAKPDEFERWIALTPYSQSEHKRATAICKNPSGYSDLEKAWAYYVNIQMSFAHKLNGGWGTGVASQNQAATWYNKTLRLPQCLQRLTDVHIACEDALDVIRRWDSPQTLHYLDPPYPETDQGHYDGYTMGDWESLCNLLDEIEGSYVLSNYPQTIEPKSAQRRIEISTRCSSSGKGKVGKGRDKSRAATVDELGDRDRTEVLWVCDRSNGMRSELQAIRYAKAEQFNLFG